MAEPAFRKARRNRHRAYGKDRAAKREARSPQELSRHPSDPFCSRDGADTGRAPPGNLTIFSLTCGFMSSRRFRRIRIIRTWHGDTPRTPRGKNGAPPQSGRARHAKPFTAPAHPAVERLRNKMRGAPIPARSITGMETPLRSESWAEAAGISRPTTPLRAARMAGRQAKRRFFFAHRRTTADLCAERSSLRPPAITRHACGVRIVRPMRQEYRGQDAPPGSGQGR